MTYHDDIGGDDRLFETAYGRLLDDLRRYGNDPSERHQEALAQVIRQFTYLATGVDEGRIGIPLPVGGGKSQAAACWSWAIWHLQLPVSVVIACGNVDNLAEIKAELLKLGVNDDTIGVLHSKHGHELPITEDNDQRQIMLVTHARLQGGMPKLEEYAFYKGKARSLVIYDESLIMADHWSIGFGELVELVGALAERQAFLEDASPVQLAVIAYLKELRSRIMAEMQAQRAGRG